jgi:hypothetical protein
MVCRLLHSPRKSHGWSYWFLELWIQTAVNGKKIQREDPVDDSLIAILVVGMIAWEFIQFAISEKARGDRVMRRDANDKESFFNHRLFGIRKK